jgi:hypothetical protein
VVSISLSTAPIYEWQQTQPCSITQTQATPLFFPFLFTSTLLASLSLYAYLGVSIWWNLMSYKLSANFLCVSLLNTMVSPFSWKLNFHHFSNRSLFSSLPLHK